ncbi:putative arginine--tRNA ligase, mitochondrial [Caenorhabditis elegans]|uniref:Probable arginine--tRNA ligase, mitochondrial n=1 Tax=Caenorhabditis elegans TaxID=6239 RepID=Q18316_CAEEL|nr:arginine--tRNA ligase [Caenorhabditis elegans]CCD66104.1 arginine--tRNA ligase [Caenorhabditis elegans]|eukprot:NP_495227.1 arginyl(R) Amino-acyl tRNA Synthetase [Caenorhabditis elegans]
MSGEVCVQTLHRLRQIGSFRSIVEQKYRTVGKSQRIVVDFSSPNIAKQFHVGNLRSTLIGRYVDKVSRVMGNEVTSVNYLGDWGTQFAMIAAFWPQMRPSDQYWNSLSDVEKIKQLTDCYVVANKNMKIDEEFRAKVYETFVAMEKAVTGEQENWKNDEHMMLWQQIKDISKNHLSEFYNLFDVKFDKWLCESSQVRKAHQYAQELIDKGFTEDLDGKTIFRLRDIDTEKKQSDGVNYAVLRKSDMSSLYLTREIAAILDRDAMFQADRYLYVVDRAQRQHFKALKVILEKIGRSDLASKIEHIQYGRVRGLSTRNGRTEAVGEIIEKGRELALQFMKSSKTFCMDPAVESDIANVLSLSTVVFNELKRARNSEYEFSFQNAFALNQNNALALQMKHSRLSSIEEKHQHLFPQIEACTKFNDFDTNDDVKRLIRLLNDLEKAVELSAEKLEACQLTVQLIHVAAAAGSVQKQLRVKDQPDEVAVPRLLLFSAVRNVLAEGLRFLGITPARSM